MKVTHVSDSLRPRGLYSPWNSPGQNTGVGSLSLLQRIFPTQGLNPGLPHCKQILYQPSHKGRPRILEWVAYPFSSGSSWPRNQIRVSCIASVFFTNCAIRKAWITDLLSVSTSGTSLSGIIQYLSFRIWHFISIMSSKFIHVVAYIRTSFLFKAE